MQAPLHTQSELTKLKQELVALSQAKAEMQTDVKFAITAPIAGIVTAYS